MTAQLEIKLTRIDTRSKDLEKKSSCRCGLCCALLTIEELNKAPGVACSNLAVSNGIASCGVYECRPQICRDYDCEGKYPEMVKILDGVVISALRGEDKYFPYGSAVLKLGERGLLRHSRLIPEIKRSDGPNVLIGEVVSAIVYPQMYNPQEIPQQYRVSEQELRKATGVDFFLRNMSADGARRLLVWSQAILQPLEEYRQDPGALYERVTSLIKEGVSLNPEINTGVGRYCKGDARIGEGDIRYLLSRRKTVDFGGPSMAFVKQLRAA